MPEQSLGFTSLCSRNSVSSGECAVVCVAVDVISLTESGVLSVVVRVCVVILQV